MAKFSGNIGFSNIHKLQIKPKTKPLKHHIQSYIQNYRETQTRARALSVTLIMILLFDNTSRDTETMS